MTQDHYRLRQKSAGVGSIVDGHQAVEALIIALRDRHPEVRASAAQALARIKNPRAIAPLIARLNDPDPLVVGYIGDALVAMSDDAVEPLIEALKDPDAKIASMAAHTLGTIGDNHALEALIACLHHDDPDMRLSAINALGQLGDARAYDPLFALLSTPKAPQEHILLALAYLNDPRSARTCAAALEAAVIIEDYELWRAAEASLTHLGRLAVPELLPLLHSPNKLLVVYALDILMAINISDTEVIEAITLLVHDSDESVRNLARRVLQKLAPDLDTDGER